jgi:hypothetical protein
MNLIMKKTILLLLLMLFGTLVYAQHNHGHNNHDDEDENEHNGCETRCTFTYGPWSSCVRGIQTRTYIANPSTCIPISDSVQRVCINTVQWLYYNAQYQAIRIVCLESPGVLTVTNPMGTIIRNYPFRAGTQGNWIDVSDLPSGLYFAVAYNKQTTFIK